MSSRSTSRSRCGRWRSPLFAVNNGYSTRSTEKALAADKSLRDHMKGKFARW